MDKPGFRIYRGDIGGSRSYHRDSLHDHWEPEDDYRSVKAVSINSFYRQNGPGSRITDRHFQNAKYQQSIPTHAPSTYVYEKEKRPGNATRRRCGLGCLILSIILFFGVAIAIPLVLLNLPQQGRGSDEVLLIMSVTTKGTFVDELLNTDSMQYQDFVQDFTKQVTDILSSEADSSIGTFTSCDVLSLKPGSIAVEFAIRYIGLTATPTTSTVYLNTLMKGITIVSTDTDTGNLGSFQIVVSSLKVISMTVISASDTVSPISTTTRTPAIIRLNNLTRMNDFTDTELVCTVSYPPEQWTDVTISSNDSTVKFQLFSNLTFLTTNAEGFVYKLNASSDMIRFGVELKDTYIDSCSVNGLFFCRIHINGYTLLEDSTNVSIQASPSKPNVTSKTVLRENENLTVVCNSDVPVHFANMLLLQRTPGDPVFTEFVTAVTNTSTSPNVRVCKHMVYMSFHINHADITNGSEFKCVVQNKMMTYSKESEIVSVIIKSTDLSLTGIERVDSFNEMNITCTAAYPHEDWSRLTIEYGSGLTSFSLWRNATTSFNQSSGFSLTSTVEESSVDFTVVFGDDPLDKCHSNGNYTCVLVAHEITVAQVVATVSITASPIKPNMSMKDTLREGEDLTVECQGEIPANTGNLHLYKKLPTSSVFTAVESIIDESNESTLTTCRFIGRRIYTIYQPELKNGTLFKCVNENSKLKTSSDSLTSSILIKKADVSISSIERVDDFDDMNITCTVTYPHEHWSRLVMNSEDGTRTFSLWRNSTIVLNPSNGFASQNSQEANEVILTVIFGIDQSVYCLSNGNYTCKLFKENAIIKESSSSISVLASSRQPSMSITTTLRTGEDLQVECKGQTAIDSGFIYLQTKQPADAQFIKMAQAFNASLEQMSNDCRRVTVKTYTFSSETLVNNTVFQCIAGNTILGDQETSAKETIIIKPIDVSMSSLHRVDDFSDINITCTVSYPHEQWARLTVASEDGTRMFSLWRNSTIVLNPSNGFTSNYSQEDNEVIFTILFGLDQSAQCLSNGNYTCKLYNDEDVLEESISSIRVLASSKQPNISTKSTLREGEDLVVECKGYVPVDSGINVLQSKQPGDAEFVEVSSSFNASSDSIFTNCRRATSAFYLIPSRELVNNTEYRCIAGNVILDDMDSSSTKTIIIKSTDMHLTNIQRVDNFDHINITCRVLFPHDDSTKIVIESIGGTRQFTLWRNCTTESNVENGFTYDVDLEENFIVFSVLFSNVPSFMCLSNDNYTCSLVGNAGIISQVTSEIIITASPLQPSITTKNTLRVDEALQIKCESDVPVYSSRLVLLFRQAGSSEFIATIPPENVTESSVSDDCRKRINQTYMFVSTGVQNHTEYKCVVEQSALSVSVDSSIQLVSVEKPDLGFVGFTRVGDFTDMNITCTVLYPHDKWSQLIVTSHESPRKFTLNRNGTTLLSPTTGFESTIIQHDNLLVFTITFDPESEVEMCVSSGIYSCSLLRDATIVDTVYTEVSITAIPMTPHLKMNNSILEGDPLYLLCEGFVPINGGELGLFALYPTSSQFIEVDDRFVSNSVQSLIYTTCRHFQSIHFVLKLFQNSNGTVFKCINKNTALDSIVESNTTAIIIGDAPIVLYDVDITDTSTSFNITCKVQFTGDHWETLSITNENSTQEFVVNQTGYQHNDQDDGFVVSHSISEGHITLNAELYAPKESMCSFNDMYTCSLRDTNYTIVADTSTIRILGFPQQPTVSLTNNLQQGESMVVGCSGPMPTEEGTLMLMWKSPADASFAITDESLLMNSTTITTNDSCHQFVSKTYLLNVNHFENQTQLKCVTSNTILQKFNSSSTETVFVKTIDIRMDNVTRLDGVVDINLSCTVNYPHVSWSYLTIQSPSTSETLTVFRNGSVASSLNSNSTHMTSFSYGMLEITVQFSKDPSYMCSLSGQYSCSLFTNEIMVATTSSDIMITASLKVPTLTMKKYFREGEIINISCEVDSPIEGGELELIYLVPGTVDHTTFEGQRFESIGQIKDSCRRFKQQVYQINIGVYPNNTIFQCQAKNSVIDTTTSSTNQTMEIRSPEIFMDDIFRVDSFADLKLTCRIVYPHEDWAYLTITSNNGSMSMIHRNGSLYSAHPNATAQGGVYDDNVTLVIEFSTIPSYLCTSTDSYVCSLFTEDNEIISITRELVLTSTLHTPTMVMKSYFKEGEEVSIECLTDLPVQGGTQELLYLNPGGQDYTVANGTRNDVIGHIQESCRRHTQSLYVLNGQLYQNDTSFKCRADNNVLQTTKTSKVHSLIIRSPEIVIDDLYSVDQSNEMSITCTVRYSHDAWTSLTILSTNTSAEYTLMRNETLIATYPDDILNGTTSYEVISLTLKFSPSRSHFCAVSGLYTCSVYTGDSLVSSALSTVTITTTLKDPSIIMQNYYNEGQVVTIECQAELPVDGGSLQLLVEDPDSGVYAIVQELPNITFGPVDSLCRQNISSFFQLRTEDYQNNTLLKCRSGNGILLSNRNSTSQSLVVKRTEIHIGDIYRIDNFSNLVISCTAQHPHDKWTNVTIVSLDMSFITTLGRNGLTQTSFPGATVNGSVSYSTVTLDIYLSSNSEQICTVSGNYSCVMFTNIGIIAESYADIFLSSSVVEPHITMNSHFREGEHISVVCEADVPVEGGSLDLVYISPTTNQIAAVTGSKRNFTEPNSSCRRFTLVVYDQKSDIHPNDTDFVCVVANSILNETRNTSAALVIRNTDMNFYDISTVNDTAMVNITCDLMFPHFEWTDVTITSLNSSISANLMRNGTYDISPSNGSTVYTSITNDRVIFSISFSDSPNITCRMSGFYTCNHKRNTTVLASKGVEINMIATIPTPTISMNETILEGDRVTITCQGEVSMIGGDIFLYEMQPNTSAYIVSVISANESIGAVKPNCRRNITKIYEFIPLRAWNNTHFKCVSVNTAISTSIESGTTVLSIRVADFEIEITLSDRVFDTKLGDPKSDEFKELATNIERELTTVLSLTDVGRSNVESVKVVSFRNGSIVVESVFTLLTTERTITDTSGNTVATVITDVDVATEIESKLIDIHDNPSNYVDITINEISNVREIHVATINSKLTQDLECQNTETDIVFVLDRSGSIGSSNYVKMKAFIANFTGNILIGEAAAQMGLVSFSSGVTTEFTLDQHLSPSLVIVAVNNISYTGGGTQIGRALTFVDANSFSFSATNSYGRHDATKVLILMTDGQSQDTSSIQAITLRDKGVLIICIGIGSGVNDAELLDITGNRTLVTHVDSFDALTSVVRLIQGSACD